MKKILVALNATLMALPVFNKNQTQEIVYIEPNDKDAYQMVNLNFSSSDKLEKVDGISSKIAIAIVEYRLKNGYFKSVDELINVSGIGPITYEKIKSKLCV